MATISGEWNGTVCVSCSQLAARHATSAMFGMEDDELTADEINDAVGELVNVVGGNIKSLVPGPSVLGLPTVIEGLPVALPTNLELAHEVRFSWMAEPVVVTVWTEPAETAGGGPTDRPPPRRPPAIGGPPRRRTAAIGGDGAPAITGTRICRHRPVLTGFPAGCPPSIRKGSHGDQAARRRARLERRRRLLRPPPRDPRLRRDQGRSRRAGDRLRALGPTVATPDGGRAGVPVGVPRLLQAQRRRRARARRTSTPCTAVADIVIDDHDGDPAPMLARYDRAPGRPTRRWCTSALSSFGLTGPYRELPGQRLHRPGRRAATWTSPATGPAAAAGRGPVGRLRRPGPSPAIAALAAAYAAAERTGVGQLVDLGGHGGHGQPAPVGPRPSTPTRAASSVGPGNRTPESFHPCQLLRVPGRMGLPRVWPSPTQWEGFCLALDLPELLIDERFADRRATASTAPTSSTPSSCPAWPALTVAELVARCRTTGCRPARFSTSPSPGRPSSSPPATSGPPRPARAGGPGARAGLPAAGRRRRRSARPRPSARTPPRWWPGLAPAGPSSARGRPDPAAPSAPGSEVPARCCSTGSGSWS